jgi:phosphoglycolate phosphatase-like HAD superfamily hydrolase
MSYDGLLLDHDGVIVTLGDRTALHDAAHDALCDVGVSDPAPDAVDTLSIAVSEAELVAVSERYDVDPGTLWRARDDRVRDALLDETTASRKAPYDDVATLADCTVPMGIVSNNQTRIVEFVLDHYDLDHHFGTIHARAPDRTSLTRKKPRPTYLEEAMVDLGIENPLYVGDSESDVEAGQRAGLDVAFLRRDHNADATLDHDPTYDVAGLDAVVEILESESARVR